MFGKLGQFADLMKNAQSMKENMKRIKAELDSMEFSGKSPDQKVEVWVSGEMNVTRISMDASLLENTDISVVEKDVLAAANTALYAVKAETQRRFSEAAGGMNLPSDLL